MTIGIELIPKGQKMLCNVDKMFNDLFRDEMIERIELIVNCTLNESQWCPQWRRFISTVAAPVAALGLQSPPPINSVFCLSFNYSEQD